MKLKLWTLIFQLMWRNSDCHLTGKNSEHGQKKKTSMPDIRHRILNYTVEKIPGRNIPSELNEARLFFISCLIKTTINNWKRPIRSVPINRERWPLEKFSESRGLKIIKNARWGAISRKNLKSFFPLSGRLCLLMFEGTSS